MSQGNDGNVYGKQFSEWIQSLMQYERVFYMNKIALACDLSYQAIYLMSVQRRKVTRPVAMVINQVAEKEVIKL